MGLYKDKLVLDTTQLAESDNVGAYLRSSTGTLITDTGARLNVDALLSDVGAGAQIDLGIFAEDSAHASGDFGQQVLAVRNDAGTSLVSADGDYAPLQVNALGQLRVAAAVTSNVEYAEDSAHTSGAIGGFVLAVRNDADTSLVSADGDYAPFQMTATGRLKVDAELDVDFDYVYAEDSAHASGDLGGYVLAVQQATLASSVSADGDYASFKLNDRGGLWTVPVGTVADDAADSENPVKVGTRALSGALAAVSASGDRANMISDMYRRLWVNDSPNIALNSFDVDVDNTAEVQLDTVVLAGRRRILVQNLDNQAIYVGPTGVLATTGLRIAAGATMEIPLGQNVPLFAIGTDASAQDVRVFQVA